MKIVKQDKKEGIVTLVPETLDDLWHLSHIVEVGDSVSSKTTRRIQDNTGDKLRSDRGVKKTFTLRIDVENIITYKVYSSSHSNHGTCPSGKILYKRNHFLQILLRQCICLVCIHTTRCTMSCC